MNFSNALFFVLFQDYMNLLIERPLQNVAFVAQVAANFWVRNGQTVRNIVSSAAPNSISLLPDAIFYPLPLPTLDL